MQHALLSTTRRLAKGMGSKDFKDKEMDSDTEFPMSTVYVGNIDGNIRQQYENR